MADKFFWVRGLLECEPQYIPDGSGMPLPKTIIGEPNLFNNAVEKLTFADMIAKWPAPEYVAS